jgi:hypothetical protein
LSNYNDTTVYCRLDVKHFESLVEFVEDRYSFYQGSPILKTDFIHLYTKESVCSVIKGTKGRAVMQGRKKADEDLYKEGKQAK